MMAGKRVLLGDDRAKTRDRSGWALNARESVSALLVMALGAAFVIVSFVDLALLWYPLALGNPVWEFGTVSGTLDNMPLGALGLTLITLGVLRHPRGPSVWLRVAGTLFAVAALAIVAMSGVYALATPAVWRQAAPESAFALRGTILKNLAQAVAYVAAFGIMAIVTWRGAAKVKKIS